MTVTSGFRTLLPFARPTAGRFGVAGALSAAASLLGLVPFWSIYRTVDVLVAGDAVRADLQRRAHVAALEAFTHEPLQQMVAPVVVFLVLLTQDVAMAVATMVSVVAAVPAFVVANRTFKRLAARRQDLQAEASSRMIEYVQGLAVIRAFRLAGERLERFRHALDDYRAVNTALAVRLAPLGMAAMATVLAGIPIVLWFGTVRLFDGATIASADEILVLDGGRIVEHGDHRTLTNSDGLYRRLWDQRQHAARWRMGADRATAVAGLVTADSPTSPSSGAP